MPQSLSAVYVHLVFSTKDRRPFLRDKATRDALHAYLGGISKQIDCAPIQIGGVEDHVHLLARFGRTITQAEWVKELKRVSNLWLKERGRDYADFEWQGGYADFSVSQSSLEQVKHTSPDRRSITARSAFRTNCARCCASTRSNGTRNTFGTESWPIRDLATTALRLNLFSNRCPR